MADSRDKPDLETLSYRNKECPAKHSSAPMGFNSVVIKPETRINNSNITGQHPELCNCIDCMPKSIEKQFEQPKYDKCRYCGAGRIVRPSGEWQFYCHCDEPGKRPVIKPETRVNKAEDTERPVCEHNWAKKGMIKVCIYCGAVNDIEQPNQNLMIIEEIEGLMSQVNDKLLIVNITVPMSDKPESRLIAQALEEIDLFQKTTLFDLRKAFE